jgi:DNA invertase Pin-like site-specific DNA recombinase
LGIGHGYENVETQGVCRSVIDTSNRRVVKILHNLDAARLAERLARRLLVRNTPPMTYESKGFSSMLEAIAANGVRVILVENVRRLMRALAQYEDVYCKATLTVAGSVPVAERPAGGPLFAKLKRGDAVISSKLDRLFRSALDALQIVGALRERKLFLTIAAAFAEAERDRIRERIGQVKADQKARG